MGIAAPAPAVPQPLMKQVRIIKHKSHISLGGGASDTTCILQPDRIHIVYPGPHSTKNFSKKKVLVYNRFVVLTMFAPCRSFLCIYKKNKNKNLTHSEVTFYMY